MFGRQTKFQSENLMADVYLGKTDLRPRIVAEQIRRLCFRLISQKKLPALALSV